MQATVGFCLRQRRVPTTTGLASVASAASTARTTSGRPLIGKSCFGVPMRLEPPAARMITLKRSLRPVAGADVVGSCMDRPSPLVQRAAIAVGENGLHFSHDRDSDLFRRFCADVQADGRVQPAFIGRFISRYAKLREYPMGSLLRTLDPEVRERPRKKIAQERNIVVVSMGHHDCQRTRLGCDAFDQAVHRANCECTRVRKTLGCGESRARIGDGHGPPEIVSEPGKWLHIVTGAEHGQHGWRQHGLKKHTLARCVGDGISESRSEDRAVVRAKSDGEPSGTPSCEVLGDRPRPGGCWRDSFDQDLNDAPASKTSTPHEIVLTGGVIRDCFRGARGHDSLSARDHIPLETTSAD